jgi:hypothetical protein
LRVRNSLLFIGVRLLGFKSEIKNHKSKILLQRSTTLSSI